MISLRLVIDTNIFVSAAIQPQGLPRTVLLLAITRPARLYVSRAILDEYAEVLGRPQLRIRQGLQRQLLDLIVKHSRKVKPLRRLQIASDPDDNKFLECADACRADYLITGNLRHFPLYLKQTKIVTARQFIQIVGPHLIR
jgi:putative PIN family toxin of toxin-antitoxin system